MLKIGFRSPIILFIFLLLAGCQENKPKTSPAKITTEVIVPDTTATLSLNEPPVSEDSAVLRLNRTILLLLKNRDYAGLANYIHPTRGVRFSPYGFVDTIRNQQLSLERFLKEISGNNEINWGEYDGSGEPMLLTLKAYLLQFVYDKDFLSAEKTSLNKMLGGGNSLNNLEAVYTGLPYVESYFSGFEKKYGGMDWCSLRLVFEKRRAQYYLVGVVHDQWTI